MTWTEEHDALIRSMYGAGQTWEAIGVALGVSKSAAVGRGLRIGLIRERRRAAPGGVPMDNTRDRSGGCRYIAGDVKRVLRRGGKLWCGAPVAGPGRAYCRDHQALCTRRGVEP